MTTAKGKRLGRLLSVAKSNKPAPVAAGVISFPDIHQSKVSPFCVKNRYC